MRRATGQGGRSAAARGLVGRDKSARREEIPKTLLTWGGMRLRRGVSGCRSGQDFFFFLFFFGWAPPVVAYKTTPLCRKRPPYMSNPCLYLSINRPVSPPPADQLPSHQHNFVIGFYKFVGILHQVLGRERKKSMRKLQIIIKKKELYSQPMICRERIFKRR